MEAQNRPNLRRFQRFHRVYPQKSGDSLIWHRFQRAFTQRSPDRVNRIEIASPPADPAPEPWFSTPPSKSSKFRTFQTGCFPDLKSPPPPPPQFHSEPPKQLSKTKSKPISITPSKLTKFNSEDLISLCQPFAGPAYSNSPPPSSLPIPKFSLRQKRSVSLELPVCKPELELRPLAKSAPTSPTGDRSIEFSIDVVIATENLRKILHLDDE